MLKSLAGSIALVAFAAVGSAVAADLPVKAPVVPAPPMWSGCYFGGYAGGASSSNVNATEPVSTTTGAFYNAPGASYGYTTGTSFIGGGTIGCNWQQPGLGLVVGMEGEAGYLNLHNSVVDPNSLAFGSDTRDSTTIGKWYGIIAARVGWAYGPALFYAKAGAVFTPTNSSVVDTCTVAPCGGGTLNATGFAPEAGWAAGGGIEYMFAPKWSVKAEYMYLGINTQTYLVCGAGGGTAAAGGTFCGNHTVGGVSTGKVGVNYYF